MYRFLDIISETKPDVLSHLIIKTLKQIDFLISEYFLRYFTFKKIPFFLFQKTVFEKNTLDR